MRTGSVVRFVRDTHNIYQQFPQVWRSQRLIQLHDDAAHFFRFSHTSMIGILEQNTLKFRLGLSESFDSQNQPSKTIPMSHFLQLIHEPGILICEFVFFRLDIDIVCWHTLKITSCALNFGQSNHLNRYFKKCLPEIQFSGLFQNSPKELVPVSIVVSLVVVQHSSFGLELIPVDV